MFVRLTERKICREKILNPNFVDDVETKAQDIRTSTADVPLLVTFDRNQVTQIQYALEVGAKKCMVKPFIPSYLKETVKEIYWVLNEG